MADDKRVDELLMNKPVLRESLNQLLPTLGRIVHWVDTPGAGLAHRAAVVTSEPAPDGSFWVYVFGLAGQTVSGMAADYRLATGEDPTGKKPGSYHYPERS